MRKRRVPGFLNPPLRDLLVAQAPGEELEDVDLANGQRIDQRLAHRARRGGVARRALGIPEGGQDPLHESGIVGFSREPSEKFRHRRALVRSPGLSPSAHSLATAGEDRVPKRLGMIALDVAVTHSLNHRGQGRVGLHADEDGGDGLLQWYQRQGMQVLPRDERLPRGPRRLVKPSDGRYCYFTARAAVGFSRNLDSLR